MLKPIRRIVIVGGGTAGWLAALHLTRVWRPRRRNPDAIEVVVVESPDIPIVGVGESTTGLFTDFVRDFTDEKRFLRETKASFKLGILHRDWRRVGEYYLGPLNFDPNLGVPRVAPFVYPYFRAAAVAEGEPSWANIVNSNLMLAHKAPYIREPGKPEARVTDYAYHFDTTIVGRFLHSQAQGVRHISGTVADVRQDPASGHVTTLVLDDGREVAGDFFIDCSGFRRLLIRGVYEEPWISYADDLPVNRALPFNLPHEEGASIPSYTHAWALSSGWMWQIPTAERMGCGYAYSDKFISREEAHAEVERVLGRGVEPWGDIRIEAGRHERVWIRNCLAVGLSAAFAEPLESTSIHSQLVQLLTLVDEYLTPDFDFDATAVLDSYNRRIAKMFDDFRDFLSLHYQGGRTDSDFWRAVPISEGAKARLELWHSKLPLTSDMDIYFGALNNALWFYTLDGLGHLSPEVARRELDALGLWPEATRARRLLRERAESAARYAVDHGAYLREVSGAAPAPAARPSTAPNRAARRASRRGK